MSTALMRLHDQARVPRLRQARCIADQQPAMSHGVACRRWPVRRWSAMTAAAARGAVGPAQALSHPPASTCTVTAVVASQVSVPSASGSGVGNG